MNSIGATLLVAGETWSATHSAAASSAVPIAVALCATLVAAGTDLWCLRVFNVLTVPLFLTGLAYRGWTDGLTGLAQGTVGVCLGLALISIPCLQGTMGGGDIKLILGLGMWLGGWLTLNVLLVAWIAAGLYSAVLLVPLPARLAGSSPLPSLHGRDRIAVIVRRPDARQRVVPFAAMLAVGVLYVGCVYWNG